MDQFVYLQFSVKPWRAQVPVKRNSIVQRISAWIALDGRTTQYREIEIAGWKMEFDIENDHIQREISFDVNWQPLARYVIEGADKLDWSDISSYCYQPTLITQVEFEDEWARLNP